MVVGYVVEREGAGLAVFQPFLGGLVAAYIELPNRFGHMVEILRGVDIDAPVEVTVLDVLRLDESQRQDVAQRREVGRAAVDVALLVDNRTLADLLEQFLQRRAGRVFGSQPRKVEPVEFLDICRYKGIGGHGGYGVCYCKCSYML